jgi:ATP-dependent exoDNAse (exonuclease V) beta subunit
MNEAVSATKVAARHDVAGLRWPDGYDRLDVIDFKIDRAPRDDERVEETHAAYVAQVAAYARILARTGVSAGKKVKKGLLSTEKGKIWWV